MMMNSRFRTGFALALGLTLFGCGGDEPVFQPPEVTVTTPEQRAVLDFFDFTGSTRAIAYAEIRARVSGVLEEMRFVPGGIVEANEILFVIERDQYQAAYQEALGNLRAAQAESARAEADLRRIEQAIRTEAVSESDLDRAVANRDQANAGVISARGRRNNAKLNLDYTLVRAPHRGQVGRNLWDIGNLVGAGEPTLLTTVNTIDSIYVYFDVAEALVLRLNQVRRETIAGGGGCESGGPHRDLPRQRDGVSARGRDRLRGQRGGSSHRDHRAPCRVREPGPQSVPRPVRAGARVRQ